MNIPIPTKPTGTGQKSHPIMSAYSATLLTRMNKGGPPLPTTRWTTKDKATGSQISIDLHHLTLETVSKGSPGLVEYLHSTFAQVVEEGKTYLIEVAEGERYSRRAFESYFFADVIVGLLADEGNRTGGSVKHQEGVDIVSRADNLFGSSGSSEDGQPPRWEDIIVGFCYVCPQLPAHWRSD